ncbi:CHAT domain-containing protein [Spirulina major]|uniref:CHAT domain-containing protein n=1 Tax=Spirulina major TaxID=270636 RepID=UPI0009338AAA|nr:CHAT domain-containing protein [Spirulina major]
MQLARFYSSAIALILWGVPLPRAIAQSIIPATDGTGTQVQFHDQTYTITGGQTSADGINLFHSLQRFGLDSGEIATFVGTAELRNILARVVGGSPSQIDGLIQVLGGRPHLYLMNPAGLLFGAGARLNVPGDFIATTATGIGFGNGQWFDAIGAADYGQLGGDPNQFAFDLTQGGAIINAGDLQVNPGQQLGLIGTTVINTGTLTASGGEITIASVPHSSLIRLSQPGHLLSLELTPPRTPSGDILAIAPLDLPTLLTGASDLDLGMTATPNTVTLRATGQPFSLDPALAIVSGRLDVRDRIGGAIQVWGDRVGLFGADLDASGDFGGGRIRVGGDDRGLGPLPTAQFTAVDAASMLNVTAHHQGDGGSAIVWADDTTQFFGQIEAEGGTFGGDGGFVEVSGYQTLVFDGQVSAIAPLGTVGTLLLDPSIITIVAGSTTAPAELGNNNPLIWGGGRLDPQEDSGAQQIGVDNLRTLLLANDLTLEVSDEIIWEAGASLDTTGFGANRTLTLRADNDITLNGNPITAGGNPLNLVLRSNTDNGTRGDINTQDITTNGGNLTIDNNNRITLGNVTTNGGAITMTLPRVQNIAAGILDSSSGATGGNVTLTGEGDITVAAINAQGGTGAGGAVLITSRKQLEVTGTFTAQDGLTASISAIGSSPGSVTIAYETGQANPTFTLGSGVTKSGTAGAITTGDRTLLPNQTFAGRNIGSINIYADTPVLLEPPPTTNPDPVPTAPTAPAPAATPPTAPNLTAISPNDLTPAANTPSSSDVMVAAGGGGGSSQMSAVSFATAEQSFTASFNAYFASGSGDAAGAIASGGSSSGSSPVAAASFNATNGSEAGIGGRSNADGDSATQAGGDTSAFSGLNTSNRDGNGDGNDGDESAAETVMTLAEAQASLRNVEAATGVKPALLYGLFVPPIGTRVEPQDTDQLYVMLVLPTGDPIVRAIPATRQMVLRVAGQFRRSVQSLEHQAYLRPAQQLHRWLIEPVVADIEAAEIHHLTFLLDDGLRSLPVAAFHNGDRFLIEDYSLSLMPSMALSDLSYVRINGLGLLAMGAETFDDHEALPAAGTEVELLTSELWQGTSLKNEDFTSDALKSTRQRTPYGMIHLATHGNFSPGTPQDSYIQLGNERLGLDELRQLGLNDPPVELMVLSACQTALGDTEAELGFAGLAVLAGVKTAVGSLWQISDLGTLGFMTSFYSQLQTASIKAEALRQAQLTLLRDRVQSQDGQLQVGDRTVPLPAALVESEGASFTHPYYWSTFTMIGTPW